jgi:transposase
MRHARSAASGGRSRLADRAHARLSWAKRYQSRFSDFREPEEEKARIELAEQIGADGRDLLEKIYTSTTHGWLQEIPAIDILRSIWIQQYHASEQGTPWRADQELPPSARLIQSPYDAEARKSQEETDRMGRIYSAFYRRV